MRPRIILADDHVLTLEGLRRAVQEDCGDVIAVVSDGRTLVQAAEELQPDVIVLDITMPCLNGIEAVRQIRGRNVAVRIIFLTMHCDVDYVREAFRCGADGYVPKNAPFAELTRAVREVSQGRKYISPAVSRAIQQHSDERYSFGRELTARQREVLQLIAEGKQAKEIAYALNISRKTVEFHKSGIMDALGLRTGAELTRYALQHGIAGNLESTSIN